MAQRPIQYETFFITITGNSDNPVTRCYYGVWEVRVRSSPKSASVALAYLKSTLDIPRKEAQIYIVADVDGNQAQDISEAGEDGGPDASVRRESFSHPSLEPYRRPSSRR